MDRSNEDWVRSLKSKGDEQEEAIADLRSIILKGLPFALSKWLSPNDPHFEGLADEVAQDTLLRVLDNIDTFEGRSKFTTWAHKIAVRVALTELRRKRWRDVSLDEMLEGTGSDSEVGLMADSSVGPETAAVQSDFLTRVGRIIDEELTEKQRQAIVATQINNVAMEEVADRMGMTRNALYKLLHDARLRLKRRLAEEGMTPEEVLESFEAG